MKLCCWFTNLFVVRVNTQLSSCNVDIVRSKPGCDEHRMIILATGSQSQTGLKDAGSPLIICLTDDNCKPHRVKKRWVKMKIYSLAESKDASLLEKLDQ